MTTISAGANPTITLPAGSKLVFSAGGAGLATVLRVGAIAPLRNMMVGVAPVTIGPFPHDHTVDVACERALTYILGTTTGTAADAVNGGSYPALWDATQAAPQLQALVSGAVNAVSGDATGATDKAAIQTALTAGGRVTLGSSGTSYVNAPLVIGSDTRLESPAGLTIKQANGANGSIITNAAMSRAQVAVTITWTAGYTASVAWTAHGLAKGDAVWVKTSTPSTTPSAYCGVFQIVSVTDANNFVIRLRRRPSAVAAGTITACKADKNISLDLRGPIDFNVAGNGSTSGTGTLAIVLGGIFGLTIDNAGIHSNTVKYCICLGAVANVRGRNLRADNANSDGLKIYGPAFDVEWDGITGNFGDDVCSIQPQEAVAFSQYDYTGGGDCINVKIRNVYATSSTGLAVMYTSQYQFADNIVFENIGGVCPNATVKLYTGSGYSNCFAGKMSLRNIEPPSAANVATVDANGSQTYYNLEIDGVVFDPSVAYSTTGSVIAFGSGSYGVTHIRRLDGLLSAGNFVGYTSTASSGELILEKSNLRGSSAGNVVSLGGSVASPKVTVRDCEIATVGNVFSIGSGMSTAPHLMLESCRVNASSVLNTSGDANITLKDCRYAGNANGILRCSVVKTIKAYATGFNELTAGNWLNISGGALVSLYGDQFLVDISAIQRVDGTYCTNSNAALGTLGATGRVTCQGTAANSWRLLGDTTLKY